MIIIPINKPYILEVTPIDCDGNFKSGLSITYQIRKSSDNTLFSSGLLSEISGGTYIKSVTFTEENQYRVLYTSPSGWENGMDQILTEDADMSDIKVLIDQILVKVCKILGLSQSNYRLTEQIYDFNGCLLSAKISIYNTSDDTCNETSPIANYQMTAIYNNDNLLIDYKVVEI